jgi:hypothetical protein
MMSGGTEGNQQLTAQLGVILLVLLAALGVTIPDLGGRPPLLRVLDRA